jgi:NhaP-type Na+/H+ or K+/H+ antiporter
MAPVTIALLGANLNWRTVALIGWLGPRGLASIVFGILALDLLIEPDGSVVAGAMAITVAISVIAHGLSAGPLANWYERVAPKDQLTTGGKNPETASEK